MLQFLTSRSEKYSIAEEAQMAIEGGCTWIQVTKSVNEGDTLKDILLEIKPLCEENNVFLMVDSEVDLSNELRIHGVHLHKGDMSPAEAREKLGPHAVIGVDVDSADDIVALRGLDIDYCVIPGFGNRFNLDEVALIIAEARAKEAVIPIVIEGHLRINDFLPLLAKGVNGFAVSRLITESPDPVETTRKILETITPKQQN